MGNTANNNKSGIIINLTNQSANDSIYFLGEDVECTVQFVDIRQHADLKLTGGYVELVGQFLLQTVGVTQINSDGTTYSIPTIEEVPFSTERRDLLSKFAQVNTKTSSEIDASDEWSFNFTLPSDLPPSFSPDITYVIRVVLETNKRHQRHIRHSIPIIVYPRIQLSNHLNLYHPLEYNGGNRKHVHLHAVIAQSVISSGLHLPIQYDLSNPNRLTIEGITILLNQYRSMSNSKPTKKVILKMDVPNVNNFQGEQLHDQFELIVPTESFPSTLNYTCNNNALLTQFNPISVSYELEMKVKSSVLFTNFALTFPVTMNMESEDNSLPPSYKSTMNLS